MIDMQPYKEYQISASTTHSTAQLLAIKSDQDNDMVPVLLQARDTSIVFKFGDSTVQADATVTSNALADGNFSVPSGAIYKVYISPTSQNYVSVEAQTGTGTGVVTLAV